MYIENPKTKDSGILCCIPQKGTCPNGCVDCFFQSGRSYLEPLNKNLPNMPNSRLANKYVVRVNDGNDSNNNQKLVINKTKYYHKRFYNTSIPIDLDKFKQPVVLTINPGKMTDNDFYKLDTFPSNLMFVRFRTNTWNIDLLKAAVTYYIDRKVPIVLTFMAYHDEQSLPEHISGKYIYRQRTTNSYWAITTEAWNSIMDNFRNIKYVHSCGRVEGEEGDTHCKYCGNCLREYHATIERMKNEK